MGNIVAIVGRPNVGKSTLFNRMVGVKKAIINEEAGTTRDRHYGKSEWNGKEFSLIDTGGYSVNSDDIFEDDIRRQVFLAIEEADVVVFMADVTTGVTDLDLSMAQIMRRSTKKIVVGVNKVDNNDRMYDVHEFYSLGLGEPIPICSMSGSGTGELLDAVAAALPEGATADEDLLDTELPKFVIIGRPNVGKSSLTNALLGEERNIVTNIAGTTRDSIHTRYNKFGMDFFLIDTAGIRKKGKVEEDLEFYSVLRSIRSIENSDVAILMLDATQGIENQDLNLFYLAVKNRKGCVIVVNKWDLVEKETNTMKKYTEDLERKLAPFNDVPIIFSSALTKQRILDVLQAATRVHENRKRRITTSQLNEFFQPIIDETPPPAIKGKYIQIKFATQLPTPTPQFAFFVNHPQYVRDSYRRFLENKLRTQWDFQGVPIQIYFRPK
ncbi:MAG: ribosome biogenesis GTPase Der [Rikenellaceae bacterium]